MAEREYRLSWESPGMMVANEIEMRYGRDCWPTIDFDDLTWHTTSVVFRGDERMEQYRNLKHWAETHEQPIRNVRLESREAPAPDEGWTEVPAA